jgi:predicted transcriptional regulator of viral defense system
MAYETRTLSEILSAAAAGFDSDLWNYAFERTVPIAIYVSTPPSTDAVALGGESTSRIANKAPMRFRPVQILR